jgi:hypothetical protein
MGVDTVVPIVKSIAEGVANTVGLAVLRFVVSDGSVGSTLGGLAVARVVGRDREARVGSVAGGFATAGCLAVARVVGWEGSGEARGRLVAGGFASTGGLAVARVVG